MERNKAEFIYALEDGDACESDVNVRQYAYVDEYFTKDKPAPFPRYGFELRKNYLSGGTCSDCDLTDSGNCNEVPCGSYNVKIYPIEKLEKAEPVESSLPKVPPANIIGIVRKNEIFINSDGHVYVTSKMSHSSAAIGHLMVPRTNSPVTVVSEPSDYDLDASGFTCIFAPSADIATSISDFQKASDQFPEIRRVGISAVAKITAKGKAKFKLKPDGYYA